MNAVTTRRLTTAPGIELDVHLAGDPGAPAVVLCHGFPETAHSWRHQIRPLAEAGYFVIAPDQRGYARSSAPRDVDAYRIDHLTGDVVAILDHFDIAQAVIVGHDWGALVTWQFGLLQPQRTRALVGASVPFTAWPARPTDLFRAVYGDDFFYMLYFQQVGPPEAELEADVATTMASILWAASGEMYARAQERLAAEGQPAPLPAAGNGFLDSMRSLAGPIPTELPVWLDAADLDEYVAAFRTSGFFGPVSWYRNLDADYDLTGHLSPAVLTMPSYFIGGTHDGVIAGRPEMLIPMETMLPGYRGKTLIEGAGHWTQQEAPDAFNDALLGFIDSLDR